MSDIIQGYQTVKSFNGLEFCILGHNNQEMRDNFDKVVNEIILSVIRIN